MATAVWQPQQEGLKEICDLLEQYRLPTVDQSRIWQQHQRCSQLPDFNNYLAFILCRAEVLLVYLVYILPRSQLERKEKNNGHFRFGLVEKQCNVHDDFGQVSIMFVWSFDRSSFASTQFSTVFSTLCYQS
jgi:hypothetical protein